MWPRWYVIPSFELRRPGDGSPSENADAVHVIPNEESVVSDVTAPPGPVDPSELGDAELRSRVRQLEQEEHAVSRRRTTLHTRIDFVRGGGYASTDPLLESLAELEATERELSTRRLELHAQIDTLRTERTLRRI
jgi:hypothetical protein